MQTITLSAAALGLLRRRFAREDVELTDENRQAYAELVQADLMIPVGSFTREMSYRFTEMGWDRRFELLGLANDSH
jgi:hypothetical protein